MFYYQQTTYSPCVPCSVQKFWEVTTDPHVCALIDQVRAQVQLGDIEKANEIKRKLPMFLFQAAEIKAHMYEGKTELNKGRIECWRSQKHIYLNGLVMLDFDNMATDPRDYFESVIKTFIGKLPILLVHITPKGKGLRVVCKADVKVGNLADNQKYFAERLGLPLDEACKDSFSRLLRLQEGGCTLLKR